MADFARFIVAAEHALPWKPGGFIESYQRSRLQVNTALADGDSVASVIRDFMDTRTTWTGLVSELYDELAPLVINRLRQPRDWPANPRWFGDRLRRAAPILRSLGIECQDRRTTTGTVVKLARVAPSATPATSSLSDARHNGDGANGATVAVEPAPISRLDGWHRP